jgi:hypothetical protein
VQAEHVAEHEHCALPGRDLSDRGDERELNGFPWSRIGRAVRGRRR